LIARYTHLCGVFLLSGLLHTYTEIAAHGGSGGDRATMSFHDSQCVRFFLTQALGIMFEDRVQEAARRVRIWRGKPDGPQMKVLNRMVGWAWVVGFLGWSTPAIMYPAARLNTGEGRDVLLPLSIVRAVRPLRE
jgi:hypothetical protein